MIGLGAVTKDQVRTVSMLSADWNNIPLGKVVSLAGLLRQLPGGKGSIDAMEVAYTRA